MAKTCNIEEQSPHKVSEVICIMCGHRWVAVRPVETRLIQLECPACHRQGFVIETGETFDND